MEKLATSDHTSLLRLASKLPAGNELRRSILGGLQRYAIEFSSKEEFQDYLKEHPDADHKNHSVKKSEGKSEGGAAPKAVSGILGKMKGAKKALVDIIKKAPKETQKMLFDDNARKEAMGKISEGIKKSPEKLAKKMWGAAKGEFEDFGHAMKASKKLLKKPPGPFSKEDKKAFYSAGSYVTGAVLAAVPPGGAIAALGAVAHSFQLHVGIKAASKVLDHGFLHYEWAETVLNVAKMGAEGGDKNKTKIEEAFFRALAEEVSNQLEELDDDAIVEIMKGEKEG